MQSCSSAHPFRRPLVLWFAAASAAAVLALLSLLLLVNLVRADLVEARAGVFICGAEDDRDVRHSGARLAGIFLDGSLVRTRGWGNGGTESKEHGACSDARDGRRQQTAGDASLTLRSR